MEDGIEVAVLRCLQSPAVLEDARSMHVHQARQADQEAARD